MTLLTSTLSQREQSAFGQFDNVPKGNKKREKNPKKLKKYVKTRRIEVIKPINEDITANQISFG